MHAPPHLTLTHYSELVESKGLALVRGDIVNPKEISVPEVSEEGQLINSSLTD